MKSNRRKAIHILNYYKNKTHKYDTLSIYQGQSNKNAKDECKVYNEEMQF